MSNTTIIGEENQSGSRNRKP